jgi:hypothetical protein
MGKTYRSHGSIGNSYDKSVDISVDACIILIIEAHNTNNGDTK